MPRLASPRGLAAVALALALAAALAPGAAAHAYLAKPMSRNLLANSDFCQCDGVCLLHSFAAQFSTRNRS